MKFDEWASPFDLFDNKAVNTSDLWPFVCNFTLRSPHEQANTRRRTRLLIEFNKRWIASIALGTKLQLRFKSAFAGDKNHLPGILLPLLTQFSIRFFRLSVSTVALSTSGFGQFFEKLCNSQLGSNAIPTALGLARADCKDFRCQIFEEVFNLSAKKKTKQKSTRMCFYSFRFGFLMMFAYSR